MSKEVVARTLRELPDHEFERSVDSPWKIYPPSMVRDELVRRLKLRKDLPFEAKRARFSEIVDRYNLTTRSLRGSSDTEVLDLIAEIDGQGRDWWQKAEERRLRIEKMMEHDLDHHRQLLDIWQLRDDHLIGKSKPGDWRPDGAEICPACSGSGTGADGRLCAKCSGKGFLSR